MKFQEARGEDRKSTSSSYEGLSSCHHQGTSAWTASMAPTALTEGDCLHCEAGPSRLVAITAAPLQINHACFVEQPDGASWFGSHDSTEPKGQSSRHSNAAHDSLAELYAETLWLGEHHTGLAHFLKCIDRLRSSHDSEDVLLGLCQLIRSNNGISRRHQALVAKLLPATGTFASECTKGLHDASEYEVLLAQRAMVAAGSDTKSTDADSLRERWVSSMQSRE